MNSLYLLTLLLVKIVLISNRRSLSDIQINDDGFAQININGVVLYGNFNESIISKTSTYSKDSNGYYELISIVTRTNNYSIKKYNNIISIKQEIKKASKIMNLTYFTIYDWNKIDYIYCFDDSFFFPLTKDYNNCSSPYLFQGNNNSIILFPESNFLNSKIYGNINKKLISNQYRKEITEDITNSETLEMALIYNDNNNILDLFDKLGEYLKLKYALNTNDKKENKLVKYLSYWTDFSSSYWYNFEKDIGYSETLIKIIKKYQENNINIHHLQLDSWWYIKGPTGNKISWENYEGGIYEFKFNNTMFPNGINEIKDKLKNISLIAHSKWVDKDGLYSKNYILSNQVSIDPLFWENTMKNLSEMGITVFEQDWLNRNATSNEQSIKDAYLFFDYMSFYAKKYDITIQYCMPTSKHVFQSLLYKNVITIRASMDGFNRSNWSWFLFNSIFVNSLGSIAYTDSVYSSDRNSLLLSLLSSGPIGLADSSTDPNKQIHFNNKYCTEYCKLPNFANIHKIAFNNGLLIKPDDPIKPVSKSLINYFETEDKLVISKAVTYLYNTNKIIAIYLFSYIETTTKDYIYFNLSDLELIPNNYLVYDYFNNKQILDTTKIKAEYNGNYYIITPLLKQSFYILGDLTYYVSLSSQRIIIEEYDYEIKLKIKFQENEGSMKLSLKLLNVVTIDIQSNNKLSKELTEDLVIITINNNKDHNEAIINLKIA